MEKVQLALERFLPELRDLERKNVFTKDEIQDIVARRRTHERSLATRDVKPLDFVRYIDYESKLEKLRRKRVARIQKTTKRTLSDHSIAAHVTQLHRQAVRRFPDSLQLWHLFIQHTLTQQSPLLVSRTLSSAIAMHPTQVEFWIMASRWESEGDEKGLGGGNTEGARKLCMRALRFLKGQQDKEELVWREWIRLETSFAEKTRARWAVLGIGKDKNGIEQITRVAPLANKNKLNGVADDMDVDENPEQESEDAIVDMPAIEDDQNGEDAQQQEQELQNAVSQKALSGQEAIIEGAIVCVVLDSCLKSYDYSLAGYELLVSTLRTLPSRLRTSLLSHVYDSLRDHIDVSSPAYPQALKILATRHLYDIVFNPKKAVETTPVDPALIHVEGEELVDAIGEAVEEFWMACKGKKGKHSSKNKAPVTVWETFCQWLADMADEVDNEALLEFLMSNLDAALSMAPPSPVLAVLRVKSLVSTSASAEDIIEAAQSLVKLYGASGQPLSTVEQAWVVFAEAVTNTPRSDAASLLDKALHAIPFSGKLWDIVSTYFETTMTVDQVVEWYEGKAIPNVLLSSAVPSVSFVSKYVDEVLPPRELVPRKFVAFLVQHEPDSVEQRLDRVSSRASSLSVEFVRTVLDILRSLHDEAQDESTEQAIGVDKTRWHSVRQLSASEWLFRAKLWERIANHPGAKASDFVAYATEALDRGDVSLSQDIIRRAQRSCQGSDKLELERRWAAVLDA
ncbi:U3 snoRNP protein [Microbotryomycetes sp. JL221]|nr:U3 snoRNP protein [Microbotryomycetes sp. JL221]